MRRILLSIVGGPLLLTGSVSAHHAFSAEFDAKKPLNFPQAVVRRVEWINPHTWIHIEIKKPDGKVERWMIEAGTPNALFRRGITRDSLKPGMVLGVSGYQAKDGSNRANGRDLAYADGKKLFMGSSGTGAPNDPEAGPARK